MSRWWERPSTFTKNDLIKRPDGHTGDYTKDCGCEECGRVHIVLVYMFEAMDPTDRVLRMPGDIYPAERTS